MTVIKLFYVLLHVNTHLQQNCSLYITEVNCYWTDIVLEISMLGRCVGLQNEAQNISK